MADLLPPPPQKTPKPLYHILPAASTLVRIFNPTSFGATATSFRSYGPIHRFDHHRLQGNGTPAHDAQRRILYAAPTLKSCIVEVFGDTSIIEKSPYQTASLTVTRDLYLLNLCKNGPMRAGTYATISKDGRRALTQEWARYFYEDAAFLRNGQKIDGIWYSNAHNEAFAVALFESCENALLCSPNDISPLDVPDLLPVLNAIANDHNMIIIP